MTALAPKPHTKLYSIVGFNFIDGAIEFINKLQPGEEVVLKREPTNKYDANAVQVWVRGQRIGYLQKKDNPPIAAAMDSRTDSAAMIGVLHFSPNSRWPHVEIVK